MSTSYHLHLFERPAVESIDSGAGRFASRLLGPVELADTSGTRRKGLLGRSGIDGALVLAPASAVHTFGMSFPIDVAFARRVGTATRKSPVVGVGLEIVDTVTMKRNRLGRPRWRSHLVIEAQAGRFAQWGLSAGSTVQIDAVTASGEAGDSSKNFCG